ncbi:32158_t:CDS:2 [Gigaspora margarita]|uniref:32158_t:CDS:1 n=1 Tax=Gigaspora margarita TaxID=4874 RepID=A0ABN7VNN7_GIGMA|nr:32158_t:CDS:2 [Gigaspora margarita]
MANQLDEWGNVINILDKFAPTKYDGPLPDDITKFNSNHSSNNQSDNSSKNSNGAYSTLSTSLLLPDDTVLMNSNMNNDADNDAIVEAEENDKTGNSDVEVNNNNETNIGADNKEQSEEVNIEDENSSRPTKSILSFNLSKKHGLHFARDLCLNKDFSEECKNFCKPLVYNQSIRESKDFFSVEEYEVYKVISNDSN